MNLIDEAIKGVGRAIDEYRCLHHQFDGEGLPLADVLSYPHDETIKTGKEEIEHLKDGILGALEDLRPRYEAECILLPVKLLDASLDALKLLKEDNPFNWKEIRDERESRIRSMEENIEEARQIMIDIEGVEK